MIEWDLWHVLLAVSRHGTYSSAARALRMDPTTISRKLKALERQLGYKLFVRVGDRLHPTSQCEDLLPNIKTAAEALRVFRKACARCGGLNDEAVALLEEFEALKAERVSPDRPITELEMSKRAIQSLKDTGLTNVGEVLDKLAEGEATLLAIDGFGRKSLSDLKKTLRKFGYQLPDAAEEIAV